MVIMEAEPISPPERPMVITAEDLTSLQGLQTAITEAELISHLIIMVEEVIRADLQIPVGEAREPDPAVAEDHHNVLHLAEVEINIQ